MTIRVGTRVRVVEDFPGDNMLGRLGTVVEVDEGDPFCPYRVQIDGETELYWFMADELVYTS